MGNYRETRAIIEPFERLYEEAKEARYHGGNYTPADLSTVERLYQRVRAAMRETLRL